VADACPGRACRRPRRGRRSIKRRSGLSEARSLNATRRERRLRAHSSAATSATGRSSVCPSDDVDLVVLRRRSRPASPRPR
jgi:hypothetical protein